MPFHSHIFCLTSFVLILFSLRTTSGTRLSNFTFSFHFHALEKEIATHSSILGMENPRDGVAWWAAQNRTQLMQLSSSSSQHRRCVRHGFDALVGKIPWRRSWQPTPVFLPGESHCQRSLAGYSPWGRKESDTTEAT